MNFKRTIIVTFLSLVHILCIGANNKQFFALGEKGSIYLYSKVDNQYKSKLIQNAFLHGSSSITDSYYVKEKRVIYVTAPLARIFEIDFNKQTDFVTEIQTKSDNSIFVWINNTTLCPVWMENEKGSKTPVLYTNSNGKIRKSDSVDDVVFVKGWAFGLTFGGWKQTSYFSEYTRVNEIDLISYRNDSWMIAGRSDQVSVYMRKRVKAYAKGESVKDVALFIDTKRKHIYGHTFEEMARPFVYSDIVVMKGESAVIQSTDGNSQNTILSRKPSTNWYFYDPHKYIIKKVILNKEFKLLHANNRKVYFSDDSHIYLYRIPSNENVELEIVAKVPIATNIIALCPVD